ncbi:ABC transporter substrate-binding protein [Bosea sp. (in: a-proteobacteria)]|jgi:putative ABC transport system substrate-binding protein|uniref:ABC transporter substrate-binding protein n=1 Tax=Bosea sp. (in: a-proteobacteria) TaxID=1871050 RepID=UPI001ACF060E|nr:ABC transporter substrate-binding protein [Bosea sp. (in: a-proteobacteria)]MBN9439659.1 ABC transporter substrate-binding protein [Bosea sp. (in: a-proteobacteria)]MBN9467901.1 ABC transporter substrate-binding protein [Bosea sp. (in: a-proteobacteria)]
MRLGASLIGSGIALALLAGTAAFAQQAQQKVTVAVTAIVEHPALDAARDGVKKALEEAGYKDGANLSFRYESAQGQPATAAQIAQKFAGENPNVIVAIATPSAQAMVTATQTIPVVFTAVTDPVAAQIVKDRKAPGGNVTGISDFSPLEAQFDLIKELVPAAKKIGVVFNPGEANSVALLNAVKALAPARNLQIVEASAGRTADVSAAAQSLVGKVDALYLPTDNTIISALGTVLAVGTDNKLPVFTGDTESVQKGSVASIGFDYFQVGLETGAVVVRILKGEKPGAIPVSNASGSNLVINAKAAAAMGVTVPPAVLARAKQVIN